MGKTRDKNNLGKVLQSQKRQVKLTKTQKSRQAAEKVKGAASMTERNNLDDIIDRLGYASMIHDHKMAAVENFNEQLEQEDSDDFDEKEVESSSQSAAAVGNLGKKSQMVEVTGSTGPRKRKASSGEQKSEVSVCELPEVDENDEDYDSEDWSTDDGDEYDEEGSDADVEDEVDDDDEDDEDYEYRHYEGDSDDDEDGRFDDEACLVIKDPQMEGPLTKLEREMAQQESLDKQAFLVIPRRPQWNAGMKPDELTLMESKVFAEWKYRISQTVQHLQHCTTTPFERNLDFWRQLWRVVERSDIVVQIVDARNPLLFFAEDLYAYCQEFDHPKKFFMLINKSDFLTEELKTKWAKYLTLRNIDFKFFCALNATPNDEQDDQLEPNKVLSGEQLIEFIKSVELEHQINKGYRTCGFIGYPNVGKSSTINHLVGASKTSTSATPGKTKHFQTLFIDSELCLCDCPGLVMPNFVKSKAELLTNGILPIDQANDLVSPIQVIGEEMGWDNLCEHYGFSSSDLKRFDARGFLEKFGRTRGFGSASVHASAAQCSKMILKDFVNGKLVYCHPPPVTKEEDNSVSSRIGGSPEKKDDSAKTEAALEDFDADFFKERGVKNAALEAKIDAQFFASKVGQMHTKGGEKYKNENGKKHFKANCKGKMRRKQKHLNDDDF